VTDHGDIIVSVADFDDRHSRAQRPDEHWGKLVHIREGREPAILASGIRNSQGVAQDAGGQVWFTDHGPMGGDELNLLRSGANYGWPLTSAGRHYDGTPVISRAATGTLSLPLATWTPAIAPSSLTIYSGREFPEWNGSFFIASLAQRHLLRLGVRDGAVHEEERLLEDLGERIRDVRADEAGRLYILTDALKGRILRIVRDKTC
jgi:aldose sugar dehydrogenase